MASVGEFIDELEEECEQVLRDVVSAHIDDVPPHIAHLMAKAAVAVLEAIIEPDEFEDDEPMESSDTV